MNDVDSTGGITIGQAAAYAGVTVKTVRHYHRCGLIDEPRRDSSGYRRYVSSDLLRLVQVRTLAAAGVPLAEIKTLLGADTEQFAAALVGVERRLDDRIEELIARRDRLHELADGDRVLLPDRAHMILDRLAALGFTSEQVTVHREGLVLFRALFPELFDDFLSLFERRLDDTRFIALSKQSWEIEDPDDPQVEELADAMAEHFLSHPDLLKASPALQARSDTAIRYGLVNRHKENRVQARLTTLVEARLRAAGVEVPHQ